MNSKFALPSLYHINRRVFWKTLYYCSPGVGTDPGFELEISVLGLKVGGDRSRGGLDSAVSGLIRRLDQVDCQCDCGSPVRPEACDGTGHPRGAFLVRVTGVCRGQVRHSSILGDEFGNYLKGVRQLGGSEGHPSCAWEGGTGERTPLDEWNLGLYVHYVVNFCYTGVGCYYSTAQYGNQGGAVLMKEGRQRAD